MSKSANALCSGICPSPINGTLCSSVCSDAVIVADRLAKVVSLFFSAVSKGGFFQESAQ